MDDVVVNAFILGISSQSTILGVNHCDVVEAEQEGAVHEHILTRHGENVRSASFDVNLVAVPSEAAQTIAVVGIHNNGNFIILSSEGGTTEGAVLNRCISDVVSLWCILEEHAAHLISIVWPNHRARGISRVDLQEVGS